MPWWTTGVYFGGPPLLCGTPWWPSLSSISPGLGMKQISGPCRCPLDSPLSLWSTANCSWRPDTGTFLLFSQSFSPSFHLYSWLWWLRYELLKPRIVVERDLEIETTSWFYLLKSAQNSGGFYRDLGTFPDYFFTELLIYCFLGVSQR